MKWFLSLPIRVHMFLLVGLLALPAVGVIIHSGLSQRQEAYRNAATDSSKLAYSISSEITILVKGAQQLTDTLAEMPEVRRLDTAAITPLLRDLTRKYPQYVNIVILGRSGQVLASALPITQPTSLADRKLFKDARASGLFSAGEYTFGRISRKPQINFGFPLKDSHGNFNGVIAVGIDLSHTSHLLKKASFPDGAEYVIVDHIGTFLYRTFEIDKYLGTPLRKGLFKAMVDGPDEGTYEFTTDAGIHRISSYLKLRLRDGEPPYIYVRAGFPIQSVMEEANASLLKDLLLLLPFFGLTLWIARFISKRCVVDRINALQDASRRLATGDFSLRVSEQVSGSELGELARTFDAMAGSLADREQSLTESESKFRSLFDSMQEGVIISEIIRDADGTPADLQCIEVNPACVQILRASRGQIIGVGDTLLDIFSGTSQRDIDRIRAVAVSGAPNHFEVQRADTCFEVHALRPDQGHLALIINDVTEQRKMHDERNRNDKLESLGVLAGGIAHDFNNFLAGIMGNISLARMKLDPSHKAHGLLGEVEQSALGAAGLARQLLTFARGGSPVKAVISVQQNLRDVAKLVLRGTNVKAVLKIPDDLQNVEADEGQITQVFYNIIINAVQAMVGGGILTISARDVSFVEYEMSPLGAGDYVKMAFTDGGNGIPAETLARIFDPYFTTKPDGSGLGLASAYSIISRHGGHINVSSTAGKGTTFDLYLPACREAIQLGSGPAKTVLPDKRDVNGRVLVMDDNQIIAKLLVDIFEHIGYSAETCSNGTEAIAIYRAALEQGTSYQAVIMDLTIPGGMGGKEAAVHLLRLDANACLIASSGYSNDPVMSDCHSYGFRAAVAKPYNVDGIVSVMAAALSKGSAAPISPSLIRHRSLI